jgi:hypothetical protein
MLDRLFSRLKVKTVGPHIATMEPPAPTMGQGSVSAPDHETGSVSTFDGFHESADLDSICGWAWDSTCPDTPIDVDIYDSETHLAIVPANLFREDLLQAKIGNGAHSFTYAVPMRLHDGQPHTIRVTIAGTAIPLRQTPLQINSTST